MQNLRLAAAGLHGLEIPAGEIFSFWAHVPRPTRRRGFVAGRELREGCIIPSIGGGLCQLSNALYDAALQAGCEIVERHAHTRHIPGSMAAAGRDATVFWNYVDLRFRPRERCQLEVCLGGTELIVRLRAAAVARVEAGATDGVARRPVPIGGSASPGPEENALAVESCESCGMRSCFRHVEPGSASTAGVTAWLVDAWWPEFDRYLREQRRPGETLFVPLDGARWRLRSYRWDTSGFARVCAAPLETLRRSWESRRLAAQGAERQKALLGFDAALARRFARKIPAEATHLVVSQNLLPILWDAGVFGGRTFDVLMTRLPLSELQAVLDRAAARHPHSRTLADFRANPALVAAEDAALAEATHWITPHRAIAKLAGRRALTLDWQLPPRVAASPPVANGNEILFPASTLGRKGAYELREVARQLGRRVRLGGPVLEAAEFWDGIRTAQVTQWDLSGVRAVVLPAWVEHQPRRLLQALAAGVPVIASQSCGLDGVEGVVTVPAGDTAALAAVLLPYSAC